MVPSNFSGRGFHWHWGSLHVNTLLVCSSIVLQSILALFLGHAYDMRIFMATGYLVGTSQNPYIAQNLTAIFHDSAFQGMTTIGYPPPWALILGLVYQITYKIVPNLLIYNLAIKIPIIAANICLAYLVARILKDLGSDKKVVRKAWLFMLFNPLLLFATSAWGQFDSIVALLSLLALVFLARGKLTGSAILLALAISFKPTAIPLIPAVFVYMRSGSLRQIFRYFALFLSAALLFSVGPFVILRWEPTIILQHWNAHFTVGGGLSFMTFLELIKNTYQLPGQWWLLGLLWAPALLIATFTLKNASIGLLNLLKISTALIMVFFLSSTWVSEPNIILVLPLILILTATGELDQRALTLVWLLTIVFGFINTSMFQLLFPSLPNLMDRILQMPDNFRTVRLVIRSIVVVPWLITGGWIVFHCIRKITRLSKKNPELIKEGDW
jgi:hypothetical protein